MPKLRRILMGISLTAVAATAARADDYYHNVAAWPVNTDQNGGYAIAAPIDFDVDVPPQNPTDWRWDSSDPGTVMYELTLPRALEPQTNFGGATLTIGSSADAKSVADCLPADQSADKTWKVKISGVEFAAFSASDDGMGHFHHITSLRALHGGKCYAIEYTIMSTNIGNYPAQYGLKEFNEAQIRDLLDRIVRTFKFQ